MPNSAPSLNDTFTPTEPLLSPTEVRIHPGGKGFGILNLAEFWRYHELFYFLIWRDIKIRYKQAALGVIWAGLQPLLSMVVFTLFFGRFAAMPSDGVPYPLFCYAGMLCWTYLSSATTKGMSSLMSSAHIITKIYFPRIIIPASAVLSGMLDLFIGFGLLAILMLYYGYFPSLPGLLAVPLLVGMSAALAFSLSLWLCSLTVNYRDIAHLAPFLIQLWMFGTPILYPLSRVPERFRWMVSINPAVGIVEGFRSALFDKPWNFESLGIALVVMSVLMVTGAYYFHRTERTLADII